MICSIKNWVLEKYRIKKLGTYEKCTYQILRTSIVGPDDTCDI